MKQARIDKTNVITMEKIKITTRYETVRYALCKEGGIHRCMLNKQCQVDAVCQEIQGHRDLYLLKLQQLS